MSSSSTPTASVPIPRANSFAIRRRPVSTATHAHKPAAQQPAYALSPPPPSAATATAGNTAVHNGNNSYSSADSIAASQMIPGPQTSNSNVSAIGTIPLPPHSPDGASMHLPPPPPGPPPPQAPSASLLTSNQPSNERPQQQQQQRQEDMMYFPPPPGQSTEPNPSSSGSSSSSSSPTVTTPSSSSSSSSSSTIPPYNPTYATTQLPYSHTQQKANGGGGGGGGMPSLGPAATPSFGLSMTGPTIPLINSRPSNSSFRRMSKYINKESAKKAYKTGLEYATKTGEWVDRMAQPAMPLLAATNPDIAAAYQLQQALRPGTMQQQQLGAAGPGGSNSGSSTGLAAVGGLAAAGLAGYAMLQAVGGDGSMDAGRYTTAADAARSDCTVSRGRPGQQPDLVSAILQQQQQQQYSDATPSLLGTLVGGGAQGVQTDPSQQIIDVIQQQSAASTQALFSAMQNSPSSAQGQQDFGTQLLNALSQQQQQQPQAQADLMAAIQQQQTASTQALLSAMQGASTNGQSYGAQALASILQQQQQQQQQPTQQANPAPSAAQQSSTLSPQEHAAYEEQLLNAALQQQQQQYGASSFASTPATQPSEAFTHNTSQPATNPPQAEPLGASQDPYPPSFSYNGPSGPSQYQQPFVPQQTGVSNPNQHIGPMNNNYSTAPQPQPQTQQHTQQGATGPNTSVPAASNTAVAPPQLQQQGETPGQPTFQGRLDNGQVELTLSYCTPQNSALPQQTQQSGDFHQYSTTPSSAPTMPAPHHPPDQFSANAALYAQVTSQHQQQLLQQQAHPASHTQQTTLAPASSTLSIAYRKQQVIPAAQQPTPRDQHISQYKAGPQRVPASSINISRHSNITPSPTRPASTKAAPGTKPKRSLDPAPPPILRPPVRPAAPVTTLQQTSPNTLIGDLDTDKGIAFEIRLLYNPTQIQYEINALRSTVSTQNFVVVKPYSSHASSPASISTLATSHNPQVTGETVTANEEADVWPKGGAAEAVVAVTINDDVDINNTQSHIHAITLASTTPDADGDILSLHKLVAIPSTNFGHGLVFSFYAPLLPPPTPPDLDLDLDHLSPVKQFAKTILDSILWVDRSTVCRVVSEKLMGTVPSEEEDGLESTAVEVVLRGLPLESVAIKSEAVNVSEEASMQHYETRTLRFLEDRKYIYNRDIVSDTADVLRANNHDNSTKKEGKEACLKDKEACYDPNHTRGCFEIYENPDSTMHLVLTENVTGSVEVQTIKLTDKGMLVRGRDYLKTS
ncbi:hypothetical protein PG997_009300 [Apiospora hydei]|uniref:Uncharacterized protein n=1 Tax=Apiospora hydei TaxID=1337664 RepID=A0ABR1VU06_9PEZI